MSEQILLKPKNWAEFQHYKKRNPPWIKLHRHLLDNYEFHCLPVASRALAPCLWLVASEHADGEIDADLTKLAFRLRQSVPEIAAALKPLIDDGFFEVLHDASATLAERLHDASAMLGREEAEAEAEREAHTSKIEVAEFGHAIPIRDTNPVVIPRSVAAAPPPNPQTTKDVDPKAFDIPAFLDKRPGGVQLVADNTEPPAKPNGKDKPKRKPSQAVQKGRGTRLTIKELPGEWKTFCANERPDIVPEKVFDAFRDYWISVSGQKGVKLDWFATWRNWVRRESTPHLKRGRGDDQYDGYMAGVRARMAAGKTEQRG